MGDEDFDDRARVQRELIATGFRRLEVAGRANEAWRSKLPSNIELALPPNVRWSPSGHRERQPSPELVAFGRLFWQARRRAGMSQQRLADRCGVSQSMISRFERGWAPAMGVRHLVVMANALGRIFPFGTCPHEHECGWQPYKPPEVQTSYVAGWLDAVLASEAKSTDRDEAPDDDFGISVTLADLSVGSEHGREE